MPADAPSGRPPPPDPLVGRVLAGTYRLDARLGRGAMGTVYRAHHLLLGQAYAVKVLHPELAEEEDVRKRFLQEARALTLFTHKNAVPVRHCGEEQGLVFLAMDLCAGETLEAVLAREGALDEGRAVRITQQVLAALEEAHRVGIVHRDLKPANVMVEPARDGRPETARVLDFGLSRILAEGRDAAAASRVSALGEVVGTVAYMSPEQALGEDLDGRSDLFSLGVLLYELVEGRHPFLGGTMASVITRLLEVEQVLADPAAPRRSSAGLQRVLGHALQKDRALRFPDAAAFAAALADLEAGRPVAPPPDPVGEARRRARRRRAALVLAGALLLVGGGAWLATTLGPSGAGTPAVHRADAARALAEGRWQDALRGYEAVVAQPGSDGEDRLALARARIGARDLDAERDLTAAARLLAGDPRVDVEWGRFYHLVKGDPARAQEAFGRALALDRGSVAARWARLELLFDATHVAWFDSRPERRLALAAADVAGLEAARASAAEVALARARLATQESQQPGADGPALAARALEHADAAVAAEPGWSETHEQRAHALLRLAGFARATERHDEGRRLAGEAAKAIGSALARVRAEPARRAQGARERDLLTLSIGARIHAWDWDGIPADVEALRRLAPTDVVSLREQAQALRTAGRFEEALLLYGTLRDIAPDASTLSDLAFCHQRIAVGHLLAGEREEGLAALGRALTAYDEAAALAPQASVLLAYRGETKLLLARYDPARRDALLGEAAADLDRAMEHVKNDGERPEVQIRRSALRQYRGDLEGAREDIAAAVAGKTMLTPAFHGRYARVLMALGAKAAQADQEERARALRDEALEQARLAADRSGDQKGSAHLLAAQVHLFTAKTPGQEPGLEAAAKAVRAAQAPGAMGSDEQAHEADLWAAVVERLGPSAPGKELPGLRAALTRAAERVAAGRDAATPDLYGALEETLEEGSLKAWVRKAAERLPP